MISDWFRDGSKVAMQFLWLHQLLQEKRSPWRYIGLRSQDCSWLIHIKPWTTQVFPCWLMWTCGGWGSNLLESWFPRGIFDWNLGGLRRIHGSLVFGSGRRLLKHGEDSFHQKMVVLGRSHLLHPEAGLWSQSLCRRTLGSIEVRPSGVSPNREVIRKRNRSSLFDFLAYSSGYPISAP